MNAGTGIIVSLILSLIACFYPIENSVASNVNYNLEQGKLIASCEFGECKLIVNHEPERTYFSYGGVDSFISYLGTMEKGVFLLSVYQGDGCPEAYVVLHIVSSSEFYFSEEFGNCNSLTSMTFDYKGILFKFPAWNTCHFSRQQEVYFYSFKEKKLHSINPRKKSQQSAGRKRPQKTN